MTRDQKIEKAAAILGPVYARMMHLKRPSNARYVRRACDEVLAIVDGDEDAALAASDLAKQRCKERGKVVVPFEKARTTEEIPA